MANAAELERYRPLIEAALERTGGEWTWDALKAEVVAGRAFPMVSPSGESIAILQPVHDLHVFTASGDMAELMAMEEEAARRAKASGFDRMTLIGREGWKRVLSDRGWKSETSLVKDL